jgi:MATE family multidrug resistance protein
MSNLQENLSETTPFLSTQISDDSQEHLNLAIFVREAKELFKLAWPVITSYIISLSNMYASCISLGHTGTQYLAASALTTMFCNVTGFSIGTGMCTALDTLCSQAFTGSNDKYLLGKHLQRSIFIVFLLSLPISVGWCFVEQFLLFLGQDLEISKISGTLTFYMIPGLFPYLANQCIHRYLQAQGIVKPNFYVMLFVSPINIFLQWFLVWSPLNVGIIGASIATSLTNIIQLLFTIFYIYKFNITEHWGGWDLKEIMNLRQLWIYCKLGIPGVLMICSEWFHYF